MSSYNPSGGAGGQSNPFQELLHLLVLVALLLVLLVVLTKFKVVHPSQVPGWQGVYCQYIEQSHPGIAFIYSSDGQGNPEALVDSLSKTRPRLRVDLLRDDEVSTERLVQYDVIILEHARSVSFKTVSAVDQYLAKGGSLIWTADAFSNQSLDSRDLQEAKQKNSTLPDWPKTYGMSYYDWFLDRATKQTGFGEFGDAYVGGFLKLQATTGATFHPLIESHLLLSGLRTIEFPAGTPLAIVNQNPEVSQLASYTYAGETYPAIIEKKYVGRIIYLAFPMESLGSESFTDNLFDYLVTCS